MSSGVLSVLLFSTGEQSLGLPSLLPLHSPHSTFPSLVSCSSRYLTLFLPRSLFSPVTVSPCGHPFCGSCLALYLRVSPVALTFRRRHKLISLSFLSSPELKPQASHVPFLQRTRYLCYPLSYPWKSLRPSHRVSSKIKWRLIDKGGGDRDE